MKARFADRLAVVSKIDPETLAAFVPSFSLQPLVENAIKYGIMPRKEGGTITIATRRDGDRLAVGVSNDGPGLEADTQTLMVHGVGLKNVRNRLQSLYGSDGRLRVQEDGTKAGSRSRSRSRSGTRRPDRETAERNPSMTIRTIIVDDEAHARRKIRDYLRAEKDVEVVGEAGNGADAIRLIEEAKPDLVFLDIQMPEPDGFGVVEALGPGKAPCIIFATAYNQYAIRAFEVHALGYLLKPFDQERFEEALNHARRMLALEKDREDFRARIRSLVEDVRKEDPYAKRFLIRSKRGIRFLEADAVLWIEAAGSYAALHTETGEHLLHEPLADLEKRLDPRRFVRTHRSFIVNGGAIVEIQPHFHGESVLLLKDDRRIRVSRNYRENFLKFLEGRS